MKRTTKKKEKSFSVIVLWALLFGDQCVLKDEGNVIFKLCHDLCHGEWRVRGERTEVKEC